MDEVDWSQTPLGPRALWPTALEGALGLVLSSPVVMTLLWGPEGVMIYNDAYARISPERHPEMFGKPVSVAWPEAVEFNTGVLRKVLGGRSLSYKDFPFLLVRDGVPTAVHFDVDYWPVPGRDRPLGAACLAVETTQAVLAAAERDAAETRARADAERWRQAEERLRELLSSARAGNWHLKAGRTAADYADAPIDIDEGCRDLLGFAADEPRTLSSWRRRLDPAALPAIEAKFQDAVLGGPAIWAHEIRIQHPTRGPRWIHERIRLVRDADGHPVEFMGLNFDVTERRQAEIALAESEARFRNMADNAPVMMWMTDLAGACIYANTSWLAFTGRSVEASLGHAWLEAMHPEDQPETLRRFKAAAAARERVDTRFRLRRADALWRWVYNVSAPRLGEAGDFTGYIGSVLDITDHVESQQALETARRVAEHAARHDSLTGLLCRAGLREVLDQKLVGAAGAARMSVLLIDLDEFKSVNDAMGHPAGDSLLVQVARRLEMCLSPTDVLGRLGGDEFLVIRTETPDRPRLEALAFEIERRLAAPFVLDGERVNVGASIGIATGEDPSTTADDLIKQADIALYEAKGAGRRGFRFFEADLEAAARERQWVRNDLRGVTARGELELLYQPIVDLATRVPLSFEALLRWDHPVLGRLGPGDFIRMAEATGDIDAIGAWVLEEACRAAASWPDGRGVSVNLSPGQFRSGALPGEVRAALDAAGLPGSRLQVEITESVLLDDDEEVLSQLAALRQLGVRVSLDDFGTGFSSLGYLRRLAIDNIKVDRVFVAGLAEDHRSRAILRALVQLGTELGLTLTAEGVETMEQLAQLRALGFREGQGFLFALPGPLPVAPVEA